jgi:hypothetical protein
MRASIVCTLIIIHFTYFKWRLQDLFQQCWRMWRLSTIARRRGVFSLRKQEAARVKNGMHAWIAYIIRLRLNPAQYVKAVEYWHRKCLEKCFGYWSWLVMQWRFPPKEEKHLTNKAFRHYNKMVLQSYFLSWQDWLKAYARPIRKKFATVQAHINRMTMKQAVAAWRCIIHVKWVRRSKYEEAESVCNNSCKRRGFTRSSHSYTLPTLPCTKCTVMDSHLCN